MGTLTAYGHSWVQGTGATAPGRRFVDLAAGALGLRADNRGVSGTLSTQTAELVRRQAPPSASAYVVMTGLNDVRLHGGAPHALDGYRAALDAILRTIALGSPSATVAVVEQPHLIDYSGHPPHDRGGDALVDRGNAVLRAVVAAVDGAVPVHVAGWEPRTMLDGDAVHPNDAGHAAIAQAVAATLGATVRGTA